MLDLPLQADMAELADALDSGSSEATRAGSTPVIRTKQKGSTIVLPFCLDKQEFENYECCVH